MERVPLRSWLILAACVIVTMLNDISGAVLNLDMPAAAHDIGSTPQQSQMILLLGKLALGALLLAGGSLGDRFGPKRVILIGAALVAAASVLSGLAPTAGLLAAGRTLDGIGNALIGPLALALCVITFPPAMRGQIIGLFLGLASSGVVVGPLLAAALVQAGGWRLGFLSPVAMALLGGAALAAMVHPPEIERGHASLDLVGMVLTAVGLTALVLGLVLAGSQGWAGAAPLALTVAGVVCLAAFAWWDLRHASAPLIGRSLLTSRAVLVAITAALLMSLVLNGTVLPFLYFVQRIHGSSPVEAVLRLLPLIVAALLVSPLAGEVAGRLGHRPVIIAGLAAVACGSAIFMSMTPQTSYLHMTFGLIFIGAGAMGVITPAADLVMGTTEKERFGSAAALNAAVIQVGGAIGIGVITSVFVTSGKQAFMARMAGLGYPPEDAQKLLQTLKEAVLETALQRVPPLPELSDTAHAGLLDAYAQAAAAGVGRSFAIAGLVAVIAIPVVFFGMPAKRRQRPVTSAD